jgi:hypothetical protein
LGALSLMQRRRELKVAFLLLLAGNLFRGF